jgi:hypothetical protein
VKSRGGMGMRLTIYSFIASILYLSWAEMGTIGAELATVPKCQYYSRGRVPLMNFLMDW